jgi:hypothetical protein
MSAILYILGNVLLTQCAAVAAPAQPIIGDAALLAREVRTIERTYSEVQVIGLAASSGLRLRSGKDTVSTPLSDVVRIAFARPREPQAGRPAPGSIRWSLAGGDRLIGQVISADKGALSIQDAHLGIVSVPLEAVAGLEVTQPTSFDKSAAWFARLPAEGDDLVLLTNGDVVRGFLSEITGDGLVWETDAGPSTIPYRLLVAARLANVEPPKGAESLSANVVLAGGTRMRLSDLRIAEGTAWGRASFGESVTFDAKAIATLEVEGGRWAWLGDSEPVSVTQTPMLGLSWEWQSNASVAGGPLMVGKQAFDRGIGVHSKSTLDYELKGAYGELVTSFGLDDSAGPLADVSVSILVDGQERFSQANVRAGELHGPIRVDLAGASRLELIVDYGRNGDIQDRFDWIEPGLIRKSH